MWLHLLGVVVWIGGVMYQAHVLVPAARAGAVTAFADAARRARPVTWTAVSVVALTGFYFPWQWRRGGQTLAMKTWRMRLVTRAGAPLTWGHALRRFAFALPGTLLFGAGFLWALVDREGLFLHDRLAGTRIVMSDE